MTRDIGTSLVTRYELKLCTFEGYPACIVSMFIFRKLFQMRCFYMVENILKFLPPHKMHILNQRKKSKKNKI